MKKSIFLLLFLSEMATAENRIVPTTTEATVYRNGAKLTSVASVSVPAGTSEVIFEGLSPYFNAQSLQVKISGSAELVSAIFQIKSAEAPKEPARARALRDSLVLLGDRMADLRAEQDVLLGESRLIESAQNRIGQPLDPSAATRLSVDELQKLAAFYSKRSLEIKNRFLAIERTQRGLDELYKKMQAELQRLQPNVGRPTGEIALKIQSPTAQRIEIECIYLVTQAGWSPIYDLRAERLDKPLRLVYKAEVRNATGFDWRQIKLRLSSGQPLANNERPVLTPVFVDFRPVQAYKMEDAAKDQIYQMQPAPNMALQEVVVTKAGVDGGNVKIRGSRDNRRNYYIDGIRVDADGASAEEELLEGDFIADFEIEARQDIPSNGQPASVKVKEEDMSCIFEHHAVPKLEAAVFLLAKVPDYGKFGLLPGMANLFLEETFVGQAAVNPNVTTDTLLLSLGRDEAVSIKRVKAKDLKERKKIFDKSEREQFAFEISVKNQKSMPIRIEIMDQIPISKNEEIVVELEEKNGAEYSPSLGKLSWRLELKPGESRKLRFEYSIKKPRGREVGQFKS